MDKKTTEPEKFPSEYKVIAEPETPKGRVLLLENRGTVQARRFMCKSTGFKWQTYCSSLEEAAKAISCKFNCEVTIDEIQRAKL